jgi:hypothetical protein
MDWVFTQNKDRNINIDPLYFHSTGIIEDCIFSNNTSSSTGGAIAIFNNANPVFRNSLMHSNLAISGGGVSITDKATPQFENVLIDSNTASSRGAAIFVSNQAHVIVDNCSLVGNSAIGPGGGISLEDFSSISIQRSTISVSFS